MIFHGNGQKSREEHISLIKRLEDGHTELSGLQQGVGINSDEYKAGMLKIKQVCVEILASFGFSDDGLEWRKLNYPEEYQKLKIKWDLKNKK